MTISSRTPEGIPHRCPTCDSVKNVDPSYPAGDSCCPSCGTLLWWFRNRLSEDFGVDADSTTLSTSFTEVGADSLDIVELVMELEEHFDVAIPDAAAEQIKTVADAIRFIAKSRRIKPV